MFESYQVVSNRFGYTINVKRAKNGRNLKFRVGKIFVQVPKFWQGTYLAL